jgi:CheY-like chemotaxis protein
MKSSAPPPATVLLVDDSKDGLIVRKLLLEEAGYSVITAANGEEALRVFAASSCDLVITDFRMPRMNGTELIEKLRKLEPNTRIILLSGFVEPFGLTQENTGADGVIAKSASEPVQLLRAVRRLLQPGPRKGPARSDAGRTRRVHVRGSGK